MATAAFTADWRIVFGTELANLQRLLTFFGVADPGVAEDLWRSYAVSRDGRRTVTSRKRG
ncbi:hypothetical protein [Streptomyces sp. NPDC008240]|uniref:hypothetical protein n=1 Tax=Streptomyces sp. NPDC008240 TaxID=3364822 RepID=UPI0036E4B0F7